VRQGALIWIDVLNRNGRVGVRRTGCSRTHFFFWAAGVGTQKKERSNHGSWEKKR
jgi:hypothetical protein